MRKQLACKDCHTPMITSAGKRCEDCKVIYRAKLKLRPAQPRKRPIKWRQ